jgi:putative tryptophan/tyrosine transport system substrate-binding protein
MQRREFITLLGGTVAAWPVAARAQQRTPRVGVLLVGAAAPPRDLELARQLSRIGYVEGRNITYEVRGADGDNNRLPQLAQELTRTNPDVIVGSTAAVAIALAAATREIPIVMAVTGDPIALGLSNSISRPSRNVTGFTTSSISLVAKRLELLRELVPGLDKVGYLWVPVHPLMKQHGEQVRMAADALGIKLVSLPVTSQADIDAAFTLTEKEHVTAVIIETNELLVRLSGTIVDECLVRDLPAMHAWPIEVHDGALISYGPATVENYPRTAIYVDRILKGAKIAELPFEEPTEFKLAINLRTARSIGITVPPTLLTRADEVIE